MKIAHIIPAFPNYLEYMAVVKTFPEAVTYAPVTQPVVEFARDEPMAGKKLRAELLPEDPEEFDVVIQGSGALISTKCLATDSRVHRMFRKCYEGGGVCAAICVGVTTLGLCLPLHGVNVTCFPLVWEVQILRDAGAIVHELPVVADKRIVTARDQMCSWMWARTVRKVVEEVFGR